ncbi:hypothetical protein BKA93DRAFT_410792 [Sparassis latifolia]
MCGVRVRGFAKQLVTIEVTRSRASRSARTLRVLWRPVLHNRSSSVASSCSMANIPAHAFNAVVANAPPPFQMFLQPVSVYGISYDLLYRSIVDPLPHGWGARTSSVYRQICNALRIDGFDHAQYSVWQRRGTAFAVWLDMMELREIEPRGIFAAALRRLQMFQVPRQIFIVTQHVRLTGMYSPNLIGPTPAALSHGLGVPMPPGWPQAPNLLPQGVRRTLPGAMNGNNWCRP